MNTFTQSTGVPFTYDRLERMFNKREICKDYPPGDDVLNPV